jgi:hypothetical protein
MDTPAAIDRKLHPGALLHRTLKHLPQTLM